MTSSKQRLWIISELFPPEETSTAYIMGEIAVALSYKYDVGVICGPEVYDKSRKCPLSTFNNDNITIRRASTKNYNKNTIIGKASSFLLVTSALYRLAQRLVKPNDKVLLVTNPAPLVVMMSRLRKKRNFELNILVHDVFPENTKAAGLSVPFYGAIKSLFDKAYSGADQLIVLGRDMKEVMELKTSRKVPVSIIENWGDFEGISPTNLPESEKIILEYAGNIGRVQGLEDVIAKLPENIEFHIYGSGAYETKLKEMDKANVIFHGPYTRKEQSSILGACHIGLVTLNDKMYGLGTPSKTYNILASGRPILYFGPDNSEIDLLVKEHKIGYCGWPEHWDRSELAAMGNKARSIGKSTYSKKVILNKFLEII